MCKLCAEQYYKAKIDSSSYLQSEIYFKLNVYEQKQKIDVLKSIIIFDKNKQR